MKSATLSFPEYWDIRSGKDWEPLKQYILDPCMFQIASDLREKLVLEIWPWNGYLVKEFIKRGVAKILLMDNSSEMLEIIRRRVDNLGFHQIQYILQDANDDWGIVSSESLDLITSNTVLNEIPELIKLFQEAYRVLKKWWRITFSVTHPSWDLFLRAQSLAWKENNKILNLWWYFDGWKQSFVMWNDSWKNSRFNKETWLFRVNHYHRTVSDYINILLGSWFRLTNFVEPKLTEEFLDKFPRFHDTSEYPIFLIISWIKE
jgi:SAM-dependent methyltransferase